MTELEMAAARNQLRHNRRMGSLAWCSDTESGPRWDGDDGRVLKLDEWQFWSDAIKAAEQARFDVLDIEYEAAKAEADL